MTPAGVDFLDHTADVGMDVRGRSFGDLLHRSALGMLALLRGEDDEEPAAAGTHAALEGGDPAPVRIRLRAESAEALLADWLREILFLHEVSRLDYVDARFERVGPDGLESLVRVAAGGHAAREIKGVTYHELRAERLPDGGWRARVIFDV